MLEAWLGDRGKIRTEFILFKLGDLTLAGFDQTKLLLNLTYLYNWAGSTWPVTCNLTGMLERDST